MPLRPDQQAYLTAQRSRPIVGGVDFSTGARLGPSAWGTGWDAEEARYERNNASRAAHNRLVNFGRIASAVPLAFAAAPAVSSLYGAGAAGSAPAAVGGAGWSMPGVSAPVFGGASGAATGAAGSAGSSLATLGRLFSSPGMNLGVNAGLTVAGMIGGNRAANQARRDQLAAQRESLALERTRLETEARNADLDREDARALNAAINELRRRELDAAEEERAFTRGQYEAREARLAPYRQLSESAVRRLQQMWGL